MDDLDLNKIEDVKGHLVLFESFLAFDKDGVLDAIRNSPRNLTEDVTREVFKGFPKTTRIPDHELERRVRSLLTQPQKASIGHKLIGQTLFPKFILPTLMLFRACCLSMIEESVHVRLEKAFNATCNVSGWTRELMTLLLKFCSHHIEGKFLPVGALDGLAKEHSAGEDQVEFISSLTKDAVVSWRRCFQFRPFEAFEASGIPPKNDISNSWDFLRTSIAMGNSLDTALALDSEIAKSRDDLEFIRDASMDLILLGIDLKDNEKVSKGIEVIEEMREKDTSGHWVDMPLLTTLGLGYVFLRNYDQAIEQMTEIPNEDFNSYVAGFLGSICAMAGQNDVAVDSFSLSLKYRKYPSSWQIDAILSLSPELKQPITSIFQSGVLSLSLGNQIMEEIDRRQRNRTSLKDPLIEPASPENGVREPSFQEAKPKTGEEEDDKDQGEYSSIAGIESIDELQRVAEIRKQLGETEGKLLEAQKKGDWGLVVELGNRLQEMSEGALEEIRSVYTVVQSLDWKHSPITALLGGEKGNGLFEKSVQRLRLLYQELSKKKSEALKNELTDFFLRMRRAGLQDHPPQEELGPEEFAKFKREVLPQLTRAENLISLKSGLTTVARFMSDFPEEEERNEIITKILEMVIKGNIDLGRNLKDIFLSIQWDPPSALKALTIFSEVGKNQVQNPNINEANFRECILPLVVSLSNIIGDSPLFTVLRSDALQEMLFSFLNSVEKEIGLDTLKLLSDTDSRNLAANLAQFSTNENRVQISREYLMKWEKLNTYLNPTERARMWSIWVDSVQRSPLEDESLSEFSAFQRLITALVEDNRYGEAVLLVSSIWRAFHDERILEGFEEPLFKGLLTILRTSPESRDFVHSILESPEWLVTHKWGILAFLYLCHVGNFSDLFEQVRYEYSSEFDRAIRHYPILVNEYFVQDRFCRNYSNNKTEQFSEEEACNGLRTLEELDHDLLKTSCFKVWLSASEYQEFFNERIRILRDRLVAKTESDLDELGGLIDHIDADRWISEADRKLGHKVKQPAYDLMSEYIIHQGLRLEKLLHLKRIVPGGALVDFLKRKSKPLSERIMMELESIDNPQSTVWTIYQEITEEMRWA